VRTSQFNYSLPEELIAQQPIGQRDHSRLLVLQRSSGKLSHRHFHEILEFLLPGDLLVVNDAKVIPARLRGVNAATGGEFEVLLLEEVAPNDWWAMLRPGKRARLDTRITFMNRSSRERSGIEAIVTEQNSEGHRRLRFSGTGNIHEALELLGEVPLPPYIERAASDDLGADAACYQTIYAQASGSVAAPTAGLHFTDELLKSIRQRGLGICSVTLHIGAGTFAPVKAATLPEHRMHEERFAVSADAASAINLARREGRRVVAIGTTTLRVLESVAAENDGAIVPGAGRTRLFVYPPHQFQVVDALLTNFHLPQSTLLMLVSAFAAPGKTSGADLVLSAYTEAIRERYRFFSYGDAMVIL
jgi:S-adenosylmethionine:tRNA ribosyltransferase-isomerase